MMCELISYLKSLSYYGLIFEIELAGRGSVLTNEEPFDSNLWEPDGTINFNDGNFFNG